MLSSSTAAPTCGPVNAPRRPTTRGASTLAAISSWRRCSHILSVMPTSTRRHASFSQASRGVGSASGQTSTTSVRHTDSRPRLLPSQTRDGSPSPRVCIAVSMRVQRLGTLTLSPRAHRLPASTFSPTHTPALATRPLAWPTSEKRHGQDTMRCGSRSWTPTAGRV